MSARLAFIDTECTGLDPVLHEIWEVGLVLRDDDGEREFLWQLPVDLGRADPMALKIGRFHERRWSVWDDTVSEGYALVGEVVDGKPTRRIVAVDGMVGWAQHFARLTDGAHLVGAVVSFDEKRLERLLRAHHACPTYHYHQADAENLAVGWLAGVRFAVGQQTPYTGESFWLGTRAWEVCEGIGHEPPWDSEALSRAVGVDPDQFDRHTALGDARWSAAIFDAVMGSR